MTFNRRYVTMAGFVAALALGVGKGFAALARPAPSASSPHPGGSKEAANTALMHRWYDEMWSNMNFALIPDLAGPVYVRHHSLAATDHIPAEQYVRLAGAAEPGGKVVDFNYRLVADGDYVGSIGRMVFSSGHEWNWVQMFRIADGKLVETWLPGMGGNDPRTYPRPQMAWVGTEVPEMGPAIGNKAILKRWYDDMWAKCDFDLIPEIAGPIYTRNDTGGPHRAYTAEQYRDTLKAVGKDWKITDFKYFLISEGDLVIAIGSWKMGAGRQWDWVQAFRIEHGKMVETWLPALGGTDPAVRHHPEAKWDRSVIPAPFYSPRP